MSSPVGVNNTGVIIGQPRLDGRLTLCLLLTLSACKRLAPEDTQTKPATSHTPSARSHAPPSTAAGSPRGRALTESPESDGPGRPGGVLRVQVDADPAHWLPGRGDPVTDRILAPLLFEPLLDCSGGGEAAPWLADRWEWLPDQLRLQMHIRSDRQFHDGRALDARDVAATLDALLEQARGGPFGGSAIELADVVAIDVPDLRTVRLKLRRPSTMLPIALCEVFVVQAETARNDVVARTARGARAPAGTGPFRVASWERGKRMRLVPAGAAGQRGPFLEEIRLEVEPDGSKALARARRGQIDLLPRVADAHLEADVDPLALRGVAELRWAEPQLWSLLLVQQRNPILRDVRVRQALSLLWNRERFGRELHHDLARPLAAPPYASDLKPAYAPAKARELLEAAGWRLDDDGRRARDGAQLKIGMLIPSGSRGAAVEARALGLELRALGATLEIEEADPEEGGAEGFGARLRSGSFDLAPLMWSGRSDGDPGLLFGADGAFNYGHYQSKQVDAWLGELRVAPTLAERDALRHRIGDQLAADLAAIFLYRYEVPALVGTRVRGLAARGDRFDLRGVWLAPSE